MKIFDITFNKLEVDFNHPSVLSVRDYLVATNEAQLLPNRVSLVMMHICIFVKVDYRVGDPCDSLAPKRSRVQLGASYFQLNM
jgi:hypothetical protein